MNTAAMKGELNNVNFNAHPVFGILMPESCPNVPAEILNPRDTWTDKAAYDKKANELASLFVKNFAQYADQANAETMAGAPVVTAAVTEYISFTCIEIEKEHPIGVSLLLASPKIDAA